jgi:hypothetical protein
MECGIQDFVLCILLFSLHEPSMTVGWESPVNAIGEKVGKKLLWRMSMAERMRVKMGVKVYPGKRKLVKAIELENGATAALVFTCLDLQRDASSFCEGFIDTPVLHGRAFCHCG